MRHVATFSAQNYNKNPEYANFAIKRFTLAVVFVLFGYDRIPKRLVVLLFPYISDAMALSPRLSSSCRQLLLSADSQTARGGDTVSLLRLAGH